MAIAAGTSGADRRGGERRPAPVRFRGLQALLAILALSGCVGVHLESRPRGRPITIDGQSGEWQDGATFIKDANLAVVLFNDGEYLDIGLTSWNQALNGETAALGLTVWFDPAGGEERTFGITYPLFEGGGTGHAPARLAIRGPGPADLKPIPLPDPSGIEVATASVSGAMVYELRVPLVKDARHPYAIGALPGGRIGIVIETPKVTPYREDRRAERAEGGGPGPGGRSGAGGGGGRGMRGGGGGARRGGGSGRGSGGSAAPEMPRTPKPFRLAVRVRLAPVVGPAAPGPASPAPPAPAPEAPATRRSSASRGREGARGATGGPGAAPD